MLINGEGLDAALYFIRRLGTVVNNDRDRLCCASTFTDLFIWPKLNDTTVHF